MDPDPDADPDTSVFITDLQDANKKLIFKKKFSCILLLRYLYVIFKDKMSKRCQNSRNQGFSYYISLMIEGSGSGSRAGSGSILLTSGSGWPKNMWIRWIRNTAEITTGAPSLKQCFEPVSGIRHFFDP